MIRVTRLAVEFVLELLADGQIESEILEEYPGQNASPVWSTLRLAWTAVAVFSHRTVSEWRSGRFQYQVSMVGHHDPCEHIVFVSNRLAVEQRFAKTDRRFEDLLTSAYPPAAK